MRNFLLSMLAAAAIALPIDMIWLATMRSYYEQHLPDMLLAQPRVLPAALFYLTFAAGLAFFAIRPNLMGGTMLSAACYGAALGFVAYGTYDATNHATLKAFPLNIMIIDWVWGTVLSALTAALAWLALSWFGYVRN